MTEALFWIEYFGLLGWNVEFSHDEHQDDSRASCGWKITGRIINLNLNRVWERRPDKIRNEEIKRCAFHEVCELLLSRIGMMGKGRISNNNDLVDEEIHNIIRTLENTIFKRKVSVK